MRRHWSYRAFAVVLTVWFAALTAEPVRLHPCPMHDGELVAMFAASAASHGSAPATGHDARAKTSPAHQHSAPGTHTPARHQCTCLGTCTAASTAGLPSTRIALANALRAPVRDPGLADYLYIPVAAQHVLPFAHAPPLQA